MKKVTLQFENIALLVDYLETIGMKKCRIFHENITVLCEASEADIELAVTGFGAVIVEHEDGP